MDEMNGSILIEIKNLLGLTEDYKAFDVQIIVFINSVFMHLNQLGVGPEEVFTITGETETWADFLGDKESWLEATKSFMFIRVKLLFDSANMTSYLIDTYERVGKEYEWRLMIQAGRKDVNNNASP